MIVMGLSLTTLVMNNNRAIKSVSLSSEFVQLTSNIQSLLNNESTCVALLGGKSFVPSTVAPSSGTLPISVTPAHSVSPLEFHGLTIAKTGFPEFGLKVTKIELDKIIDNTEPDEIAVAITKKNIL